MKLFSNPKIVKFSLFAGGLILGFGLTLLIPEANQTRNFQEIRKPGNYKFINPLLECENTSFENTENLKKIKRTIEEDVINEFIDDKKVSFVSVYFRDLNNGPWFGINERALFSPASLIKVPLMIAYYKQSESDPLILSKEITVDLKTESTPQNIIPEQTIQPDQVYKVDDLINRMIIYSDNLAYDVLMENIDPAEVFKVYSDLGVDISQSQSNPNGNIISVKDYASFFRILFNSSYLEKDTSEKALKLLSQTSFKKALSAGVPRDIKISHKFGERQYLDTGEKQLHDCGIVYLPGKPYLLCVMTKSNDFGHATQTIKEISSTIFNTINSQ